MNFNKDKAINQAQVLAKDFDESEAYSYGSKNKDKAWYDNFILLLDLVRDKDFYIDSKVYLAIAGALAYVIMPIDVIPDFIPGLGFIDDIFVLGVVMKSLSDEVERYEIYLEEK